MINIGEESDRAMDFMNGSTAVKHKLTSKSKSVADIIAAAPMVHAPKPVKEFTVRPGSLAVCEMIIGDAVAARLCQAFLELRVETKKLITREKDGTARDWIFLSSDELMALSGLSQKQVYDRAIPKLKNTSFFIIEQGRVRTKDKAKKYQIAFDHDAFWFEVAAILDPTIKVSHKVGDVTLIEELIDRAQLPYVFKRLLDLTIAGAKFPK
ncbi:hypothetical protein GFL54_19050 [Rhizobium laguerreae]|uniref:hypothetical protein n=1 Tax=Rhizobium laguerreae TaxID=1076926 RepID=UPI00143F5100|nr:hypothetical protein [Rhizobium laguerreae]NKM86361.1 hypothetical protein [Rhizobium laguerreae]